MKKLVIGILAHVDAGKTTLSESLLYVSGSIRRLGRVDNRDAFLDTYELERARGITIFSKQAVFSSGELEITLLDTPGHVDFSPEMERTLQVLDYAVLVVSGADGVQGHTLTLWRLLKRHRIPVFLFINKMDQEGCDRAALLFELKDRLDENIVDFGAPEDERFENLAVCDEAALENYLETGTVTTEETVRLFAERKAFPCYFGSALRVTGVEEFLRGLETYTAAPSYPEKFGAKVFKIARDEQGRRLTYLKVTGGALKVRELLAGTAKDGTRWEEKVQELRRYSGAKYEALTECGAGTVCAAVGLTQTYPGQGLGAERASEGELLEPVLTYRLLLPEGCDVHSALLKLRQLEEEEPKLHLVWDEAAQEIRVHLMGEVQIEVLKSLIAQRFGLAVEFGEGSIVYKETIAAPVTGGGHFEPLRHYAEVRLLLEPGEPGSGLEFAADCSEDLLDRNWQRLILTHLEEREHRGVLTGSAITDLRITLIAGRAHQKHTEGGDFRQATYRAVRQGLKKAQSVLLEPYYRFRLEVPAENIGRAMADIQKRNGEFAPPVPSGELTILEGSVPAASFRGYQRELISYTRGMGRLSCTLDGYRPCQNADEVIENIGYDSERDLEQPTGSVFCAHGAGFVVSWEQVDDYLHTELRQEKKETPPPEVQKRPQRTPFGSLAQEKELEEIFARTYGAQKKERPAFRRRISADGGETAYHPKKAAKKLPQYLLVDGYNIIFAWEELAELAKVNIDGARDRLMDILSNYQGWKKCTVILVFDAYKVKGNPGSLLAYHNIHVVYTKEAETADRYIEKTAHEIGQKYDVTVATSDGVEQVIIMGQGCLRLSAKELKEEIQLANREMRERLGGEKGGRNYLFDHLPEELGDYMEEVRLGKKEI